MISGDDARQATAKAHADARAAQQDAMAARGALEAAKEVRCQKKKKKNQNFS
jgi:hypothetical protein